MKSSGETTIRVPTGLRDRIKEEAARRGVKQADLVDLALRELAQAEFLRAVASTEWDEAANAEAREWDDADLGDRMDPWQPTL